MAPSRAGRRYRGRVRPARRPTAARRRPSTRPTRPHRGPTRGARSSVTHAETTTRSAPRSPQNWSSPCAHTPPPHPTGPPLVHKSAPTHRRTPRSQRHATGRPATVIKVRFDPLAAPAVDRLDDLVAALIAGLDCPVVA